MPCPLLDWGSCREKGFLENPEPTFDGDFKRSGKCPPLADKQRGGASAPFLYLGFISPYLFC